MLSQFITLGQLSAAQGSPQIPSSMGTPIRRPLSVANGGNQRLYSERDIRKIIWLREQTALGLTISQAIT